MDLIERIDQVQALVEAHDPEIHALLPEEGRFDRLRREAQVLVNRFASRENRPPLFGLLFGVKDIFHVEGWPTRAGSRVPAEALRGPHAESVSRLQAAGALILGKTVTTEFAHFAPGPTRNPHNPAHTPGGSSSGSAAAVAAGFCELALGTQTIGSIVRPASFCGIVGLKPTFGRVSTRGVVPLAPSLDHVGCLATDVRAAMRAARVLYTTWSDEQPPESRPRLGIPEGPYLDHLPRDTAGWFRDLSRAVADAGYHVRHVPAMADFDVICERHHTILAAEAARSHAAWFREYEPVYGEKTAELIRRGQSVRPDEYEQALRGQARWRSELRRLMIDAGIDAWICPSTLGPAPEGLESTGDPIMNLPWTHAGFPVVALPAGRHASGLPMGVQIVGNWTADERLLVQAETLEATLLSATGSSPQSS